MVSRAVHLVRACARARARAQSRISETLAGVSDLKIEHSPPDRGFLATED